MSSTEVVELSREELARILEEAELLRNLAQNLQRQATLVNTLIREIETAREVLSQIQNIELGTEILVPIGATTYIRASIRDKEKALVGIGANYVIEVPMSNVVSILERRQRELEKNLESIQSNLSRVLTRLSQIERLLERIRVQTRPSGSEERR